VQYLLIEDHKEQSVGPPLTRVTYALHVHNDWVVQSSTAAIIIDVWTADRYDEAYNPPHSQQEEHHWQPRQFLVYPGVRCLELSLDADAAVFCAASSSLDHTLQSETRELRIRMVA
jgi:hypothetical protein